MTGNLRARAVREALGRSRGGLSTKIHLAADSRCRPVTGILTPGQHGDCPQFIPLLDQVRIARRGKGRPAPGRAGRWPIRRTRPRRTAPTCASAGSRRSSRSRRTRRCTAATRGRAGGRPPAFDAGRYRDRNTVERCFSKLKQFRAVATRYDKRDYMYQGTVDVASIRIWL
jgi:transposase